MLARLVYDVCEVTVSIGSIYRTVKDGGFTFYNNTDTATDIFCELRPFTNNIYNSAGFEIFRTFPGALMSVFKSFAREELG